MASDPINVDVGAMLQGVSQIESSHDSIASQVENLQNEFSSLSATWGGAAATGFQSAMGQFYETCQTILVALHSLATGVDNSAIFYNNAHGQSTDQAQALKRQIDSTPIGLPGF